MPCRAMDELGYLPFAQSGGQLLFHLISQLYERTSIIPLGRLLRNRLPGSGYNKSDLCRMANRIR